MMNRLIDPSEGSIVSSLLKEKPEGSTQREKVFDQAKKGIYQQDQLVLLKPMAYQNIYALAVKESWT